MNTKVILKEVRPLFWPWCAVILAGALPLIRPLHSIGWISLIAFFLGIPLLATLPLGNEFQHRTFSLLLSQPVARIRIWGDKLCVAFVAVVSAALVFFFSPSMATALPNLEERAIAGALIIAMIASATYWTLFTKSTIGGVALGVGTLVVIVLFLSLATGVGGIEHFLPANFALVSITALLCYAGLMLWLGERKLARYQVTGSMAGDDLLTAGSDAMPLALAGLWVCRPTGTVLNLIRKEFRLLRPVWLITLLTASGWTCLTVLDLLRERRPTNDLPLATVVVGVACAVIIAILAGCLSLGEEKTSGAYAWHRTLPVSALLQWFVKLCVALFVGFVCAGLLPVVLMVAGKFFFGSPFALADSNFQSLWLLGVLLLTAASFWCACAVNGTVPAVLWVSPILIAVTVVPEIGNWAGSHFEDFIVSKLDLLANFRLAVAVSNMNHRFGLYKVTFGLAHGYISTSELFVVWVPTLILAVIQSYRLFRAPIQNSALSVVQKLFPLLMLAFLCSFSLSGIPRIAGDASGQVFRLTGGAHWAIENILSIDSNRETMRPLQLTGDDLERAHAFPEETLRLLRNSRITVIPDKAHPTPFLLGAGPMKLPWWNYVATIHLASGADVTLSADGPLRQHFLKARIHWPGTVGEDPVLDW